MVPKGFFEVLFDLSFTEFLATRLIKVLFVLGVVFSALGALMLIVGGFSVGFLRGLLMLILSPLIFLLYVIFVRIWCEVIIALFRIAENTGRLAEQRRTEPGTG